MIRRPPCSTRTDTPFPDTTLFRSIVMRNAEIAQEGSPRDLYEAPADNFVADSIGDANLVEAEIAALQDGQALVRIGAVERRLLARGLGPGAVKVAIRPEAIRNARNGSGGILEAEVVKATNLGG